MGANKSTLQVRNALSDVWIADNQRISCFHCGSNFGLTLRRHHCRVCGELFCKQCWGASVHLPQELYPDLDVTDPQPACVACEKVLAFARPLWTTGVVVRIAEVTLKKTDPSKPQRFSDAATARFILRMDRWRPFNNLTCLHIDRIVVDGGPRATITTAPVSPDSTLLHTPDTTFSATSARRQKSFTKTLAALSTESTRSAPTDREAVEAADPVTLPEKWEMSLSDVFNVALVTVDNVLTLRCETRSEALLFAAYADIASEEADTVLIRQLEDAVRSAVELARRRTRVRMTETTTKSGGGTKQFTKESRRS